MISNRHKCIFIHVPKCAGTSVAHALIGKKYHRFDSDKGIWIQHATAEETRSIYAPEDTDIDRWKEYYKFGFVRNPFDRLLSSYMYLCRLKKREATDQDFEDFVFQKKWFNTLLDPKKSRQYKNRYHQVRPAYEYLFIDNELAVDFVGTFENLSSDWDILRNKIKSLPNLPHLNKGMPLDYKRYYVAKTKAKVYELFNNDFEHFKYTF